MYSQTSNDGFCVTRLQFLSAGVIAVIYMTDSRIVVALSTRVHPSLRTIYQNKCIKRAKELAAPCVSVLLESLNWIDIL